MIIELEEIQYETKVLIIDGMTCASCSSSIENDIKSMYGIKSIYVNLITGKAVVEYDSSISIRNVINRINDLGFDAKLVTDLSYEDKTIDKLEKELDNIRWKLYLCIVSGLIATIIMVLMILNIKSKSYFGVSIFTMITLVLSICIQVFIGKKHYIDVWKQIKKGLANMSTLVILSTTLSFCLSVWMLIRNIWIGDEVYETFFDTSIFIFMFVYIGKYLELNGKLWAARLMTNIIKNDNAKVRIVRDVSRLNEYIHIDNNLVNVGDIVLIKPGENILCDGKIVYGETHVDESILTGESSPVYKKMNDVVYGGSINISETICIEATGTGNNTCLNKIKKLVEDAQTTKTSFQNITDKICGWFVYAVVSIAIVTCIVWLFVGVRVDLPNNFNNITYAVYVSISVIIVACPCALGLATPIAIMVGTGVAMKYGILLKNGSEAVEKISKTNTIIFDKTGTLTYGKLKIVDIYSSEESLLEDAYILSCISNHPLSLCIRENMRTYERDKEITNEKSHVGKGVECMINKKKHYLGSYKWLSKEVFESTEELRDKLNNLINHGLSIVVHAIDNKIVNIYGMTDTIREETYSLIKKLKNMNMDIWIVSGDNKNTVLRVAKEIGIDESKILAEVLPEDKAQIIESIKNIEVYDLWSYLKGGRYMRIDKKLVAMVGDGGNDSVALSQADVGICMRSGSDLALSSADIVLMSSNIMDVYYLKVLSKKIMRTIYLNLFFATIYNFVAIPLAAGVFYPMHLNPMCAGLAMSLSSVIVVGNSMLLKYI